MARKLYQTSVTDPVDHAERQLADEIAEAIERPIQATAEDDDPGGYLPPLALPGFGDPYDDCGDEIPHFCEDCGHTFTVGRTCRRSVCPRCAPAWVVDRATTAVGKLDTTARIMSSDRDGQAVFKHHVVISPPDDWYLRANDPLEATFDVIKEILGIMDAEGVVGFHPWTGNHDFEDDRGQWKRRLFAGRDWEGDVRSELMPRGHFHAIVASPFIPGGDVTRLVEERTGWVIHRVAKRDGSGHSLSDLEDVARAVTYTLSHTGIRHTDDPDRNNQAQYRYVGPTINDPGTDVYDDVAREASMAVRAVAPDTLGIDSQAVRCGREFETNATDPMETTLWDLADGEAPDAGDVQEDATSGAETSADSATDGEHEALLRRCTGDIRPIDDAPDFLENEEWRAQAAKADELQTTWEDWSGEGGWHAWPG